MRLYARHIECWLGGQRVLERPRATPVDGQRHARDIDKLHLVAALKRKPGAFARWVLRDAVFPRAVYRQTWERLAAALPERQACKAIVGLLALAADGHEAQLTSKLEQLIELDQLPDRSPGRAADTAHQPGARRGGAAARPGRVRPAAGTAGQRPGGDAMSGAPISAGRLELMLSERRLPTVRRRRVRR